jgi:hypothetical protein
VITPGVSAGSNHVGASVTVRAKVIRPSAAATGAASASQDERDRRHYRRAVSHTVLRDVP